MNSTITICAALLVTASALGGTNSTQRTIPPSDRYTRTARIDSGGVVRSEYGLSYSHPGLDAEGVARAFLSTRASGLLAGSTSSLETSSIIRVPGGTHVRFRQTIGGIPVFRGSVVVSLNDNLAVGMVVNNAAPGLTVPTLVPSLTSDDALARARHSLDIRGASIGSRDGSTLMIYGDERTTHRLAYRVTITTEHPAGDWEVFVDATNGAILHTEDRFVMDHVQGSGFVYLTDPLSAARKTYNSPGFTDANDATSDSLDAYRTLVTLDSVTFEGGVYALRGPYVSITDIETPFDPEYTAASPDSFLFDRSAQEFEAVNAYYHATASYKRLLELGFDSPSLAGLRLDPHGFQGQDNSHYSPTGNWIAMGEGGVDDAEDADVIWHEIGHAIQYNFIPDWGGGEAGALGEGFGDYWAASYSRSMAQWPASTQQYHWVFNWDGHNPFWLGRTTNDARTYPFGNLEIHTAGQIWSTALMGIWNDLGRDLTDLLVLKSLLYLGSNVTAPDWARAIVQADRDLFGGAHVNTLVYWLGTIKHFLNPDEYLPVIAHTPGFESPAPLGPFTIRATVTGPNTVSAVYLHWQHPGGLEDSVLMVPSLVSGQYWGSIPAVDSVSVFRYFFSAADSLGTRVTCPSAAPASYYQFQAGNDTSAPAIVYTPVTSWLPSLWPAPVHALVSDNVGVDSVWVEYTINNLQTVLSFPLSSSDSRHFGGMFPPMTLAAGDYVSYRVRARDASTEGNVTSLPASGRFVVTLADAPGMILVVDDPVTDPTDTVYTSPKGTQSIEIPPAYDVQGTMTRAVRSAGFLVNRTHFQDLDTAMLHAFSAVVLLAGLNDRPFDEPVKRRAIVSYVRNGGKVLVEGGEVGYFYRREGTRDADADFRRTVLHDSSFVSDADPSSSLTLDTRDRLFFSPNLLPPLIGMTSRSSFGDRDVVTRIPGDASSRGAGDWSNFPGVSPFIISYANPTSVSSIFLTFALASVSDSASAGLLMENTIAYLTSRLTTAIGSPAADVPATFALDQNYPNPFNPSTTFHFTLPEASRLVITVYDAVGREVARPADGEFPPGTHAATWTARTGSGESLASGTYFYRIEATGIVTGAAYSHSRKMLLLK